MTHLTGGCLCGDVRYETSAGPLFAGFCHCKDCQKATGGGHSAIGAFPAGAVTVTKGETTKYITVGGTGKTVTRQFCNRCGSGLFSGSELNPAVLMVTAGSLDDPNMLQPATHIFGKDKPAWDHVSPSHMLFDHLPPGPPPSE